MKTINLGKINLTIYDGPVGIRASGGADSSLLLFYLALHHPGPIFVYNLAEEMNDYLEEGHMVRVVNKISELTENTNIIIKNFRVPKKHIDILMDITNTAAKEDNVTMLYTGITKRPPREFEKYFKSAFNEGNTSTFRDPETEVPTLYEKTYMPLANINKKDVKDLYDKAGITESLFPVTFSCTADLRKHCGECWWCEERIWAFGKI